MTETEETQQIAAAKFKHEAYRNAVLFKLVDADKIKAFDAMPENIQESFLCRDYKDVCIPLMCRDRESGRSLDQIGIRYSICKSTVFKWLGKKCRPCCG